MADSIGTAVAEALRNNKRSVFVDPDSTEILTDAKRSKVELDATKKSKCLGAIALGYELILIEYFGAAMVVGENDVEAPNLDKERAHRSLNVSTQIANIIFTMHTIARQTAMGKTDTNTQKRAGTTEFTITMEGQEYNKAKNTLLAIWKAAVAGVELEYKNFEQNNAENWYGTFGPYIDFFCGFGLRLKELRLGHDKMPITKRDGVSVEFPVKKYGLSGAHHILLEGCTFLPEKSSSMAQSVGPMTAFLCMVKSEGDYRRKWANAVKRAFNHVPGIDEIIEITKTQKRASEISATITLLAEIIMITTSRQATRMFFPLNIFVDAFNSCRDKLAFCNFFNTSGSGGYFVYKIASEAKPAGTYTLECSMTQEKAGQVVFHAIFGTFKEDLSILKEITNVKTWFTREEIGKGFVKPAAGTAGVNVKLPKMNKYAKLSSANQTGLLSGVYTQVSAIPVFSGYRTQVFGNDFFEHIQKKATAGPLAKSIPQINGALAVVLDELHDKIKKDRNRLEMGTKSTKSSNSISTKFVVNSVPAAPHLRRNSVTSGLKC